MLLRTGQLEAVSQLPSAFLTCEVEPAARHVGLDRKVSVVLVLAVPGKVLKRSLHDEGAVGAAAAENAGL